MFDLKSKSILVLDIETDSLDVQSAKVKWVGAYSFMEDKYYEIPYTEKGKITSLLQRHRNLVTFNGTDFDIPIIERHFRIKLYQNKIDLLTISRQRLATMGVRVKDYSLRTIAQELKLGEGKGNIDYTILQKDNWTEEETKLIKEYLQQDIITTKQLLEYFNNIFQSTVEMLSKEDVEKLIHIKASPASLSYRAILNNAGIKYEFTSMDDKPAERQTFEGAHHIEPRENQCKGNIVSIDFASMYPHMVIMCNLLTPKEASWSGNDFIKLKGSYDNQTQGKIEQSLNQILLERLEAKKNKNKPKNMGYKVLINSFYGTLGNNSFKTTYNPIAAGDCTSTARTILKRLAKTLEEYGFKVLYGFTDNVMVLIPEQSSKEELIFIANNYIKQILSKMPFPKETFKLELDKEIKFIKFFAKNCYLYVTKDNQIENTSTLLNKNTPSIVMKVFKEYITPKIVSELDCNFTELELKNKLLEYLKDKIKDASEQFSSKPLSEYKVKSSLEYQISEKYGVGKHNLIPNLAGVGVGKSKDTKKRKGLRYCTYEEFQDEKLSVDDIDMDRLVAYIKPFYQKEIKQSEIQNTLEQ